MKLKSNSLIFFFLLSIILSTTTHAKKIQDSSTISKLEAAFKNTKTVEATFREEIFFKTIGTKKTSEGTLVLKRPFFVRWDIKKPDPSLFVSNGNTAWYYTPPFFKGDQGQATHIQKKGVFKNLAMRLLSGSIDLKKEFSIKLLDPKALKVELKPLKSSEQDTESILLTLDKKVYYPKEIEIHQMGGNITTVYLNELKFNGSIDTSQFSFTPPKGTAIVTQK